MLLSEAPITALKATKSRVSVEALIRCRPKFMARMKAKGPSMTIQPSMFMPPVSLKRSMMAPLVAKYQATAPVMDRPAAIQPNTAFMKPRSSVTMGALPAKSVGRCPPLNRRGGS